MNNVRVVDEKEKLTLKYNLIFLNEDLDIQKKYNFIILEQKK